MFIQNKVSAQSEWQAPTKIWSRMFLGIFFANMMLNLGQQMSNSLLAKYADALGAPASQIGMLMSMFALTALVFRFIAGPAMDSFNRKFLVMGAMSFMSAAYFGFSAASSIHTLMVFRLVQGIGNAFANACCLAIVSDVLPKNKFNTGIGYYSCAQVVSQAIGPTVGLALVKRFGYSSTYLMNAGVMIIAILVTAQVKLPVREPKKFSLKLNHMIAREALVPASITFFVSMGFTCISSFLIVYAAKRGVEDGIGLFFTIYALAMLVTRPAVGRLTEMFGFVKVGIPAIFMTMISLVFIGFSNRLWMFLVSAFINAFGYGAVQPALQTLCMKSVPQERRGSASSTNYIGTDAATLIGPTLAGFVAGKAGYTPVMWIVMTIPLFIGIGTTFCFRSNINRIEADFFSHIKITLPGGGVSKDESM